MFFETERLIIRKWDEKDIYDLLSGMNSRSVSAGFGTPYPYTQRDAETYLKKVKTKTASGSIYYAIEYKETNKVIGGGGIYQKNGKHSIGIWINEQYQGLGFGREVLSGAIRYSFEELNLSEVYAYFHEWNISSKNIIKSCNLSLNENPYSNDTLSFGYMDKEDYFRTRKQP